MDAVFSGPNGPFRIDSPALRPRLPEFSYAYGKFEGSLPSGGGGDAEFSFASWKFSIGSSEFREENSEFGKGDGESGKHDGEFRWLEAQFREAGREFREGEPEF